MAVAQSYFKLLARKDEYEVARLHSQAAFHQELANQFEGPYRLRFHLAPAFIAGKDPATGLPVKREFGSWIMVVFRALSACRGLRDTIFDPFRFSSERRLERKLLSDYETLVAQLIAHVESHNHVHAVDLARLPLKVRGYGYVKLRAAEAVEKEQVRLMTAFSSAVLQSRAVG